MAATNAANRSGVFYGGGQISGQNQAQRDYSAQNQTRRRSSSRSLSRSLNEQNALAQQGYG